MRRSSVRSFLGSCLAAGLGLVLASPALAYVVVLKGGKRHIAIDKPVERDGQLTFVEKGSRAEYTVAIGEVDLEKTKEVNGAGTGDARLLGPDTTTKVLKPPASSRPSLNDRVQTLKKTPRAGAKSEGPSSGEPEPAPAKRTSSAKKKGSKTPTPTPGGPPDK